MTKQKRSKGDISTQKILSEFGLMFLTWTREFLNVKKRN